MSRRETTHTSCESESASPMISQSATGSFEKVRYDESFTASWHSSGSSSASGARPSRARFALYASTKSRLRHPHSLRTYASGSVIFLRSRSAASIASGAQPS